VLTFRRVTACCAVAAASAVAAAVGAPGALAASGIPARPASLGPGATVQLIKDTANAWQISQGNGVTVAVLSTGVDPNAVGLQGKVTIGHDYVSLPYPDPTSGTIIASAIAGSGPTGSSPIGPIGRAPQAKILGIRVLPESTIPGAQAYLNQEDWQDVVASAITEAVNSGAKVIYDTLVGYESSQALETAVQYAISKNVVVVSDEYGFGNDPNAPLYPAALPGVLGAGTVFLPGLPPPSPTQASPVNESILVGAPGNELFASGPDGPGYYVQNEWAAAAWLVGTAALIKSVYPDLAPALVARAIALSARDHPPGGYNTTIGFGLVNPAGALQEASVLAKLRGTAAPGPGVVSASARLVSGPAPGVIDAVHHSRAKLAAFGGAIAFGLICLVLAAVLAWRWRRRPAAAAPAPAVPLP
jgi:Subtilase family